MECRQSLLLVGLLAMVGCAHGFFRGDPVQTFKRMQFQGKRTMWSDVLVGQGPLYAVDRSVELNYPYNDIAASDTLKMQLAYDHEKFSSEWITVSDGNGNHLDVLTVELVYSGNEIHEIRHKYRYKQVEPHEPHPDRITVEYHWISEADTDTRMGLDFLFAAGCCVTVLVVFVTSSDNGDLSAKRAIVVPEYENPEARKPKIKKFLLFDKESEATGGRVIGDNDTESIVTNAEEEGLRARKVEERPSDAKKGE
uniref:Uncharacterized protein n=1 Tax=Guillardia theta TaxID=55529 RepID=A0A7S4NS96_GUITH